METSKLIKTLRFCGDPESCCSQCPSGDRVTEYTATECLCDLMQKAADTIEALQAELRDEMHRHDRLQDFEVAEAQQLAEAKETAAMLRKKWQAASDIICAHCTECKCETHNGVLVMQKKCGEIAGFPDCDMFTSRNAVELFRMKESHRWIPVTERLPEDDEVVLIACKIGKMFVGYHKHLYPGCEVWRILTARDSTKNITYTVTHWMPLPEPPKEVE